MRPSTQQRLHRSFAWIILGGWGAFTIFLILWVMMASLKSTRALFGKPFEIPTAPAFGNYAKVWVTIAQRRSRNGLPLAL